MQNSFLPSIFLHFHFCIELQDYGKKKEEDKSIEPQNNFKPPFRSALFSTCTLCDD